MRFLFHFTLLLSITSGLCQEVKLSAYVYSATDSSAIAAASVYFDGSTIGTSTNATGYFSIAYSASISNPLVISMLGFETLYLDATQLDQTRKYHIYLKESTEQLDAVQLETDPWSRKRKLKEFKREFLGRSRFAVSCKIPNEEHLELRYSPSSKRLYASASAPILIKNKALGYKIRYELMDFYVNYDSGSSGLVYVTDTYYEGTSYFQIINDKKKSRRNRKEAFKGSLLHFMRSLAHRTLKENNFRIFHDRFEVPAYQFFTLSTTGSRTWVKLETEELSILYDNTDQSIFQAVQDFYIDEWGNHSPPSAIRTGGNMGKDRVAELVPIDYSTED